MPELKLNRSYYKNLKSVIDNQIFLHSLDSFDFEVNFQNDLDDEVFIEIYHKKFVDQIGLVGSTEDCVNAVLVLSPFYNVNQHTLYANVDEVHGHIEHWFRFVSSEIEALEHEMREIKAKTISHTIAPVLKSFVTSPDSYFSKEEVENIKTRLDSLETYFKELKETSDLNQEAIAELTNLIEKIKDSAASEQQQKWYDRTLHHLSQWAGRIEKVEKLANAISKGSDLIEKLPL